MSKDYMKKIHATTYLTYLGFLISTPTLWCMQDRLQGLLQRHLQEQSLTQIEATPLEIPQHMRQSFEVYDDFAEEQSEELHQWRIDHAAEKGTPEYKDRLEEARAETQTPDYLRWWAREREIKRQQQELLQLKQEFETLQKQQIDPWLFSYFPYHQSTPTKVFLEISQPQEMQVERQQLPVQRASETEYERRVHQTILEQAFKFPPRVTQPRHIPTKIQPHIWPDTYEERAFVAFARANPDWKNEFTPEAMRARKQAIDSERKRLRSIR